MVGLRIIGKNDSSSKKENIATVLRLFYAMAAVFLMFSLICNFVKGANASFINTGDIGNSNVVPNSESCILRKRNAYTLKDMCDNRHYLSVPTDVACDFFSGCLGEDRYVPFELNIRHCEEITNDCKKAVEGYGKFTRFEDFVCSHFATIESGANERLSWGLCGDVFMMNGKPVRVISFKPEINIS